MLQTVTSFIRQKLDQHLVNSFSLEESIAVLNHLALHDGSAPPKNRNKMVITVINLDYDTNKPFFGGQQRAGDNRIIRFNPGYTFNVDLLFTASFDDYEESLKFLNGTIEYFQSNICVTRSSAPDLPRGVHSLRFDILNSTLSETHNLWSAIGAKYQPSVIYKVRHITVQQERINVISPPVLNVNRSTAGNLE